MLRFFLNAKLNLMLNWASCLIVLAAQAFMIKGTVKSANVEVGLVFSGTTYSGFYD